MFVLNSDITIGELRFSGVHDVRVKRGIYDYRSSCTIKVPSIAVIGKGKRSTPARLTTGTLFTDGDKVVVKLGYNGQLVTEFEGFVKRRNLNMPLEVECEGYERQLRQKVINVNTSKGIDVKKLLALACEGTDVTVDCNIAFKVYGRNLVNANGLTILDEIKKCSDSTLTIFFIEPKKLYCGLVYTAYLVGTKVFDLPTVKYRLGYNVVKDNALKERIPDDTVQVIINGQLATGDSVRTESDNKVAKRKVTSLLNGVRETSLLKQFANEKANHHNYSGYEGTINAFLRPYALPGYDAIIKDARYPERDGTYLIESTEVTFGMNGGRRKVGIGPKLSGNG